LLALYWVGVGVSTKGFHRTITTYIAALPRLPIMTVPFLTYHY
jgi:hypothetical protein